MSDATPKTLPLPLEVGGLGKCTLTDETKAMLAPPGTGMKGTRLLVRYVVNEQGQRSPVVVGVEPPKSEPKASDGSPFGDEVFRLAVERASR